MAVYKDFAELVTKLHQHVVATDRMPVCDDQPALRQVGWLDEATGESWRADITAVKRWQSGLLEERLQKASRDLMATQEGRQRFASYLLQKAREERSKPFSEPSVPTFWERLLATDSTPS